MKVANAMPAFKVGIFVGGTEGCEEEDGTGREREGDEPIFFEVLVLRFESAHSAAVVAAWPYHRKIKNNGQ